MVHYSSLLSYCHLISAKHKKTIRKRYCRLFYRDNHMCFSLTQNTKDHLRRTYVYDNKTFAFTCMLKRSSCWVFQEIISEGFNSFFDPNSCQTISSINLRFIHIIYCLSFLVITSYLGDLFAPP